MTLVVAFLGLVFVGMTWQTGGLLAALLSLSLPALLAYATWWIWGSPRLVADSRGILVRNQVRTTRIAWDAFVEAESQFGLYLTVRPDVGDSEAPLERVFAAAVPARGGFSASRQSAMPEVPELHFEPGPKVTLKTTPAVAAALLNEEKLLAPRVNRPPTHQASPRQLEGWAERGPVSRWLYGEPPAEPPTPFVGVRTTTDWVRVAAGAVLLAAALAYGLNF